MQIVTRSNYLIYIDDVRVDPYVVNFSTNLGLYASDAAASIVMFRSDAMDAWKPYLNQVKIFAENPFTKKFVLIFDGDILSRNWNQSRRNMGMVTFQISGHYHWLEIPVPLAISTDDALNQMQRFIYEAQNINIEEVTTLIQTQADSMMKNKSIEEIIKELFETITLGYYEVAKENSAFGFAKLQERFKVMVDVLAEFREAGFLDMFTFTYATQIDSFLVYIGQILDQLMFEFYEDRDGSFRIKGPSWSDDILKSHILTSSLIDVVNGLDDWKNEPTRVLAIGSSSQLLGGAGLTGGAITQDPVLSATVPVGLYIGDPRRPDTEVYYNQNFDVSGQNGQYTGDIGGTPGNGNASSTAAAILNGARQWLGRLTYTLGKGTIESGNGDCSIFTEYVFRKYGTMNISKPTSAQINQGVEISEDQAQPGDLVFFHKTMSSRPPGQPSHVGIVSAKNTMIHLSSSGCQEQDYKNNSYWGIRILGYRRVLTDIASAPAQSTTNSSVAAPTNGSALGSALGSAGINTISYQPEAWQQFEMTAYDAFCGALPGYAACTGITATGLDVRNQKIDHRVVAVDPTVIPLHSIVEIAGMGLFNAMDTGGMIKGKKIDILFPSAASSRVFGRQNRQVRIVRRGKGDGTKVQPVPFTGSYTDPLGGSMGSTFSPYAGVGTEYVPKSLKRNDSFGGNNSSTNESQKPKAISYPSGTSVSIPSYAQEFSALIKDKPSGIDDNLIAAIIAESSGWSEKHQSSDHVGLMGISESYAADNLSGKNLKDGSESIYYGSQFLSSALSQLGNKVTLALAAYFLGDVQRVKNIINSSGSNDFSVIRSKFDAATVSFVDKVIDQYAETSNGDYIKGDPHRSISEGEGNIATSEGGDGNYEEYEPHLSEEELRFKMNLKIIEQPLIRNDSSLLGGETGLSADKLMYFYSKYMMQLYRARAHNVNVNLMTCLPFLRPGFNAWLEPNRTDLVIYITSISHQGSFAQGCYTSINGGFVRDPETFQDVDQSFFIGDVKSTAKDFGETFNSSDMSSLRNKIKEVESQDTVEEAQNIPFFKEIYVSDKEENDYTTEWNKEYTVSEIETKISELYNGAPSVIQIRRQEVRDVIQKSKDIFIEKLNYLQK